MIIETSFFSSGKDYFAYFQGKKLKHHNVRRYPWHYIQNFDEGTKVMISCGFRSSVGRKIEQELELLLQKGYTESWLMGKLLCRGPDREKEVAKRKNMRFWSTDVSGPKKDEMRNKSIQNCQTPVQTAPFEGLEMWKITISDPKKQKLFLRSIWGDGRWFSKLTPSVNFPSPSIIHLAATKPVKDFGNVARNRSSDLVIRTRNFRSMKGALSSLARRNLPGHGLDPLLKRNWVWLSDHSALSMSSAKRKKAFFGTGNKYFKRAECIFWDLENQNIQDSVIGWCSPESRRSKANLSRLSGTRLRKTLLMWKFAENPFKIIVLFGPLMRLCPFFEKIELAVPTKAKIANRLLKEIVSPLGIYGSGGLGDILT